MQRFKYRAATKSEFDKAWAVALQTFARTGNWGGAEAGIRSATRTPTAGGPRGLRSMLLEDTAQKRGRTRFGDGRWQIALAKLEAVRCESAICNRIPEILGLKIRQSVLDASKIDNPDRFEITEVFIMPTTTSTMLDQITVQKTQISERMAWLDPDREKIATQ